MGQNYYVLWNQKGNIFINLINFDNINKQIQAVG